MKKKIVLFLTLAAIAVNFSSCVVREDGHRHWGHHHHHHEAAIIVR